MKRLSSPCLILTLAALFFTGCGKQPAKSQSKEKSAAGPASGFVTVDQRVSYGIGHNMGSGLMREGIVVVDREALIAGLTDGIAGGKPRGPESELNAAFAALQQRAAAAAAAAAEKQLAAGTE